MNTTSTPLTRFSSHDLINNYSAEFERISPHGQTTPPVPGSVLELNPDNLYFNTVANSPQTIDVYLHGETEAHILWIGTDEDPFFAKFVRPWLANPSIVPEPLIKLDPFPGPGHKHPGMPDNFPRNFTILKAPAVPFMMAPETQFPISVGFTPMGHDDPYSAMLYIIHGALQDPVTVEVPLKGVSW